MGKLTDRGIKAITADGRHGDGAGLALFVRGGSRLWVYRWMTAGKPHEMALGTYPEVTLAEARDAALAARRVVKSGGNPLADRQAAKAVTGRTFEAVAAEYIESHRAGWKNAKHGAQWASTLETYAFPTIGQMPVQAIGTDDVLAILKTIWITKPETATRLRGRIESVLDYAKSRGWRTGENPAAWRGHLDNLLPARSKVAAVVHHAAVPWRELPALFDRIQTSSAISSQCLAFTILTAARSGEARGARWNEIGVVKITTERGGVATEVSINVWTIPASRMKAGREHRIPLSDAAMAVLEAMKPHKRADDSLVFPGGVIGKPMSDVALNKALAVAGGDATVHGFRSSFRDWAAEATGTPREIAEAALAHANRDKVESAYMRGDHIEKRREMMEVWAAHCGSVHKGNVVSIRA